MLEPILPSTMELCNRTMQSNDIILSYDIEIFRNSYAIDYPSVRVYGYT